LVEIYLPPKRHLKDKEVKQLLKDFIQRYSSAEQVLKSASDLEELLVEDGSIIFADQRPLILRTQTGLLPSLKFKEVINSLPKVVVDMGAVPHVVNGAQIMRPGIREVKGDFGKGDLIVIVDEKFGKAIALGLADMDSGVMKSMSKGKVITNVHYVGDTLWNSFSPTKSP
jgi:PUA domain protein